MEHVKSLLILEAWLFVIANQLIHGVLFLALHVFLAWHFADYWFIVIPLFLPFTLILAYGWWVETRVMMRAFASRVR